MTTYNGDEILEIAQQIERNGERFYRHAASTVSDKSARKILAQLADWELKHEALFAGWQHDMTGQQLDDPRWFDPENEGALYLQMIADSEVFRTTLEPESLLPANTELNRVFEVAISMEKESVVFYTAMLSAVPPELGLNQLEEVIREELKHVRILTRERDKAAGKA